MNSKSIITTHRYRIFAFVFAMYAINYCDRAALSIALPALSLEFHLNAIQLGLLSSSFLWSYFLLNLPAGILLDLKGSRIVGVLAVSLWSTAMALGGMVQNIWQLFFTRVLLGVGEAPTFPIGGRAVRDWALPSERGTITTILYAGMHTGVALGTAGGAALIASAGWRWEFILLGCVGVIWSIGWWLIYPNELSQGVKAPRIIRFSEANRLMQSSAFIALLVAACLGNFCNFLLISWMPVYVQHQLRLDLTDVGEWTAFTYLAGAFMAIALGYCAERSLLRRPFSIIRRRFLIGGFLISAACLMAVLPSVKGLMSLGVVSLMIAAMNAASGNIFAMLVELLDDNTKVGSVVGLVLTISNFLGIFAPILAGYILYVTGTFDAAWYLGSSGMALGGGMAILMVRRSIGMGVSAKVV